MKNKVISIIFLVFAIILVVSLFFGIKIGDFKILSISELQQKNEDLDAKIETASRLTSIDYPENIEILEDTYEQYKIKKQEYEEISGFTQDDKKHIYETKQYDIAYLWKIVGKYATSRNLTINMDVKKTSEESIYDLYFTISGEYVNISEFITDIENNSDLYFRIYNFKMSGSSEVISSSFTVKDVNIDPSTITNTNTTISSTTNSDMTNSDTTNADTTNSDTTNDTQTATDVSTQATEGETME